MKGLERGFNELLESGGDSVGTLKENSQLRLSVLMTMSLVCSSFSGLFQDNIYIEIVAIHTHTTISCEMPVSMCWYGTLMLLFHTLIYHTYYGLISVRVHQI